jgi:hypothetical protein
MATLAAKADDDLLMVERAGNEHITTFAVCKAEKRGIVTEGRDFEGSGSAKRVEPDRRKPGTPN